MPQAGWAANGILAFATSVVPARGVVAQEAEPFTHDAHVQSVWFRGNRGEEVQRDCRGCHAFEAEQVRDPQPVCADCHYREFALEGPGFERDLAALREEVQVAGFTHGDHLALACRMCHLASNLGQPPALGGKDLPIPGGFGHCAACHGPGSTFGQLSEAVPNRLRGSTGPKPGWQEAFYAGLNADARMGPEALGRFLHTEHMLAVEGAITIDASVPSTTARAADSTCATCHGSIPAASAGDLAEKEYEDAGCRRCHKDADGPLEFARGLESRPSLTALTFAHRDHLDAASWTREQASAQAYADIERSSCLACHGFDDALQTFALREPAWSYATCLGCHAQPPWNAAGLAADHAERRWWHGNWERCGACHSFGAGDMESERPTVAVERRRPVAFEILGQSHPFITAGTERDATCAQCHLADVDELPSRVRKRAFRHATHVPAPTEDNRDELRASCEHCHASRVRTTAGPAEIGTKLDEAVLDEESELFGLTYDPEACIECHRGSAPKPIFAEAAARNVVAFPHEVHVGSGDPDAPSCVTCHVGSSASPAYLTGDVGVTEGARTCLDCHRHDEGEIAAFTGGATKSDVESCALCHAQGIPALEAQLDLPRARVAGIGGTQFHPADEECASCHVVDPTALIQEPAVPDHVFARHANPHDSTPGATQRGPEESGCLDCHWNSIVETMPDDQDPQSAAIRQRFGNEMSSNAGGPFPGHAQR